MKAYFLEEIDCMTSVCEILRRARRLHFVGIGGSGMFPLVEILHAKGYTITGSDALEGSIIDREREMGLEVHIGHAAENVEGADALVVTAALLAGNPEVARAEELGIPVIERAELLGYVSSLYDSAFCISGTHGKTTTTSMLTSIFVEAGADPSAVIGGKLPLIHSYGLCGHSDKVVIEACEFKDTFLHLSPDFSVILNIDADHLDYFGSLDGVKKSFRAFAEKASRLIVANGDDRNTRDALDGIEKPVVWFGESKTCEYRITQIENYARAFHSFALTDPDGVTHGPFRLSVPGRHNVWNAAAAAVCALLAGIGDEGIAAGFKSFQGAGRRFEILGEFGGVTIADDYAHHPAELRATLTAAKEMGYSRVIAVFQPFTYSRTKLLLNDFAEVLRLADVVVMTEIMGSREVNTFNIYTADLAAKIEGSVWFNSFEEICDHCLQIARPGDLILTLGCGDIYKAAKMMVKKCTNYRD